MQSKSIYKVPNGKLLKISLDYDGRTPLSFAEKNGYSEVAELLRKHGAKE
jgi:ankyrin repeat protein